MTNNRNITEIVKELQKLHAEYPKARWYERAGVFYSFNVKMREVFPSIAIAYLANEEKLQKTVEALEKIKNLQCNCTVGKFCTCADWMADTAQMALSSLQNPTPDEKGQETGENEIGDYVETLSWIQDLADPASYTIEGCDSPEVRLAKIKMCCDDILPTVPLPNSL